MPNEKKEVLVDNIRRNKNKRRVNIGAKKEKEEKKRKKNIKKKSEHVATKGGWELKKMQWKVIAKQNERLIWRTDGERKELHALCVCVCGLCR